MTDHMNNRGSSLKRILNDCNTYLLAAFMAAGILLTFLALNALLYHLAGFIIGLPMSGGEIVLTIIAVAIGFIFDVIYIAVGDLVIGKIMYFFPAVIFFSYIIIVGVLGVKAIIKFGNHVKKKRHFLLPVISIAAGVYTHYLCAIHDTVVYYHLHGKFMNPADDFGYYYFLHYLAAVYLLWAIVAVVFPLFKGGNPWRKLV